MKKFWVARFNFDHKKQNLERKLEELESIEAHVNMELEQAESSSGERHKRVVKSWLFNVERVKNKAQSIQQLGDRIDELTKQIKELIGNTGRFPRGLLHDDSTTNAGGDASSCSSAINDWKYDVFLSFRGEDTRNNFTSHLYRALRKENLNVCMDTQLERGEEIPSAIALSIECSRVSLVVFSPNYASSTHCLDELVNILECKESRGQIVLPIFYNVDPLDVRKQKGSYAKAFSKHKVNFRGGSVMNNLKMERWKSALAKTATLSGWHINTCYDVEAEFIEKIVKEVLEKLHSYTGGDAIPNSDMLGKEFRKNTKKILECLSNSEILRIGIYGMGGVGKTTLMTHVHNFIRQKPERFGCVYWVTVSRHVSADFSVSKLQDLIAKTITIDFSGEDDEKKRAAKLSNELNRKGKCVLILDDLWNYFSEEKVGLPIEVNKCQLVLTSRSFKVCTQMDCQEKIKVADPR